MNKYIMFLVALVGLVMFSGVEAKAIQTCNRATPCPTTCGYNGGFVWESNPYLGCILKACNATPSCPVAVNGGWGEFGDWSVCDNTACGTICKQNRTRTCNNPTPANGGLECEGLPTEVKETANVACEVAVTCPTACGLAESTVPDGLGGLTTCLATEACATPVVTPTATTTVETTATTTVDHTPSKWRPTSVGGDRPLYQSNPRLWLVTQIHFIESAIERLQAQLNKLLGI